MSIEHWNILLLLSNLTILFTCNSDFTICDKKAILK